MAPYSGTPVSSYDGYSYSPHYAVTQTDGPPVSALSGHTVHGSPQPLHRTVGTNTPPSPGFGRRVVTPTTMSHAAGSPSLNRHPLAVHSSGAVPSGSPGLVRHQMVMTGSTPVTPGSPSLERHIMHGYTTPEERRPTLSRQSSASGYQAPSTPSFPVSPAYYQGMSSPSSSSPDSTLYRQGSPVPQPSLPEKRRMSSGDRSNSLPNYSTLNGKASSPMSSGMSSPSGGSTMAFTHTLPDFSKFSMPGSRPLSLGVHCMAKHMWTQTPHPYVLMPTPLCCYNSFLLFYKDYPLDLLKWLLGFACILTWKHQYNHRAQLAVGIQR